MEADPSEVARRRHESVRGKPDHMSRHLLLVSAAAKYLYNPGWSASPSCPTDRRELPRRGGSSSHYHSPGKAGRGNSAARESWGFFASQTFSPTCVRIALLRPRRYIARLYLIRHEVSAPQCQQFNAKFWPNALFARTEGMANAP